MWIQVRSISGSKTVRIDDLSKLTKIEDLRKRLVEPFDAEPDKQRLFFRGKQMEDGHTLFDYDVGLNDLIQILIRKNVSYPTSAEKVESGDEEKSSENTDDGSSSDKENKEPIVPIETASVSSDGAIYKVGDIIDARDVGIGAWFEAKIIKVEPEIHADIKQRLQENANSGSAPSKESNSTNVDENDNPSKKVSDVSAHKKPPAALDFGTPDGFTYHICFDKYPEDVLKVLSTEIRPRARTLLKFQDVEIGQHIMANYNYEEPERRGFWYDCYITGKRDTRTIKELTATVYIGCGLTPLNNCRLLFVKELFGIELPGSQLTEEDVASNPNANIEKRENKPECDVCNDNPTKKCKDCGCVMCGDKKDPEKTILCDECNKAYHLYCLNPPLATVPEEDEWYCPNCKNDDTAIVRIGEKLKANKKKSKMASANSTSNRDWGKGMACVGRSKMCTVVPSHHYGAIPGVEVGTLWKFRVQVSEAGVHRPHVAGIHGREEDGAYSIVLSGGYEDDKDDGDEFYYTGSGGRDLSGNKRTAEQSCDQTLTRMNKALAKNCNAPVDNKKGASAKDWKGGKPVRVVRNCKGRKHSDYAPEEGNRYDGIYKVVKYWPEKGKSGFLVWRYLLRRDDPIPAPWTEDGQKRIEELGLKMQYPEGYVEAEKEKESNETPGKKGKKRKTDEKTTDVDSTPEPSAKKTKVVKYSIESGIKKLISEDSVNKKLWNEALSFVKEGSKVFHDKVEEIFLCICCQDLVCKPITLSCSHNICKSCLQRSFKAEVYSCPACRADLDQKMTPTINSKLSQILNNLFPGYEAGR
ncbi:E3 ubiquitin-protein ligase UHRF1-like isoform X2 [Physella acuta]|uniref:E3 ubiquitin-protein ligase UHRF1-like isoform X2 n=1 Tax=Physella acuta TaxID=109671 RepID=UPI0027DC2E01|nr:E3 ubiquitin-protein ligase UHRF1-like isoform X2 [Physella acuta]